MCHCVRVPLSADDKSAARKLAGFLLPAYAAVALAAIAVTVAVTDGGRAPPANQIAITFPPASR